MTDQQVAANNGIWTVDAGGARRTDDDGDLARRHQRARPPPISAAPAWHTLAAAGSVDVRNDKAIAIADNLFASRPLPFSGSFF